MEGGEVALLDCGQVKIINTKSRIALAELVVLVNRWEQANAIDPESVDSKAVITLIAEKVRGFGVQFAEGVGDECAGQ